MDIDYHRAIQGKIASEIDEGTTLEKAAKVRLDNLGYVQSHSCFVNQPERLDRLRSRLELQKSLGSVHTAQKKTAADARKAEDDNLRKLLPSAVQMFKAQHHGKKFTKNHIKAILVLIFENTLPKRGPLSYRDKWLESLITFNENNPAKLASYTPPVPEDSDVTQPSSAPLQLSPPNLNAQRIFNRCEEARCNLGSNVPSTLKLAQVVLQVVQRIKGEGFDEDRDYTDYFFSAFNSNVVEKRDIDMIYDFAYEMLDELVEDDGLTFEELQKLEG